MPSIKKSCIESIKQRVSLSEVASSLVRLKKSGSLLRGLSPFNHEKTPSFFINPEKNLFTCYSSGKSGDLFEFVMQTENLSFPESVETIAQRFGIELEYEDDGKALQSISLNSRLIKLHESAAALFQQTFAADTEEAAAMRRYWTEQRGFTLEQAREFGIGYAPAQPHAILEALRQEGHSAEIWRESGLFFSRPGETNLKHFGLRFAGRLMIPIRDIQSRVIGFSGRVTEWTPDGPSKEAKYVNSPETPIFKKSDILFGLHHARLHLKEGQPLLIVEGQLDAMRCWACGIHATVAPQGTAITAQQMALVRRYTERIEFLLDGDRAGVEAALRALPLVWKAGLEPVFLRLPDGADPDSLLREQGAQAIESLRAHATGAVPFLYQSLLPNGPRSDRSEKRRFLQEFFSYVSHIESQVLQQDVMAELARLLGITTELLVQDYAKQQRKVQVHRDAPAKPQASMRTPGISSSLERDILTFLLHYLQYGPALAQFIEHEWLDTSAAEGQLLDRLLIEFIEGGPVDEQSLSSLLYTDEERALVHEVLCHPLQVENPQTIANHSITKLYQRHLKSRIDELDQKTHNAGNTQDIQLVNQLQRQRQLLLKQLRTPPQIPENLLN